MAEMNFEEQVIEIKKEIEFLENTKENFNGNYASDFFREYKSSPVGMISKNLGTEPYLESLNNKIEELEYKLEMLVYNQMNEISDIIRKHNIELNLLIDFRQPIKTVTQNQLKRSIPSNPSFIHTEKISFGNIITYYFINYQNGVTVDELKTQLRKESDFFSFQDVVLVNGKPHFDKVFEETENLLKKFKIVDKKNQITIIGKLVITMIQDLIIIDKKYKNWVLNSGITLNEILLQLHQVVNQKQDDLVAAIIKCSGNENISDKLLVIEKFLVNDLHKLAKKFEGS